MTHLRKEQEIFNIAYRGMASQRFQPSLKKGVCQYRGSSGRRCAIGWLIDDNDYYSKLEGKRAADISIRRAAKIDDCIGRDFLRNLQACHDGYLIGFLGDFSHLQQPDEIKNAMESFAHHYDLTIPEVN